MEYTLDDGALVAVTKCMKVNSKDSVLIVADNPSKDIGMAIRQRSLEVTDKVRFFNLDLPAYGGRPLKFMPESLTEAIKKATVTFFVAGPAEGELETLRGPFLKLCAQKARHAHMVGVDNKIMTTGMCVDYEKVALVTDRLFNMLINVKEMKVTSPAGTDFIATFNGNMKWIPCSGIVDKVGQWDNLPSGEVFTAPRTFRGRMVIDGTVGDWIEMKYSGKVNYQETPLIIDVEHEIGGSFITKMKCDHKELLADFKAYVNSEPNSSRIGELGLGTNVFLKEIIDNILQDEKFPTVHVAFGDPYHEKTGATWLSDYHIDLLMRKCNVWIDGFQIMDEGKYIKEILG
ncbi:MAG: aminopeptidase [Candidatus Thermoplasmatota archaeon]|nr:aminopeptidase [Candidatus Thermoplasmatota archaeon]MBU4070766.1 aminopeptidase [Candidatus Thermoplasmatota archaeon]MBU4144685.1 aminopeptidase [Candidatus Thermoplasmatota archaeon]MBU4592754.1 aminopeptidase [Candidatus Thermoplasmatota archaeon]